MFGAVVVYPALGVITSLRAHSSEWGPIILLLKRVGRVLLRMLLKLRVFWRDVRLLVFVLQKGVEVVLVVLVRGCEMRAGPGVLSVPLIPLRSPQAVLLLALAKFELARVALAHRLPSAGLGRLGAIFFFVACETEAAAEALLLAGLGRVRRLRLVRASARLRIVALGRLWPALQLLERRLVERDSRAMAMARDALRERLLLWLLSELRRLRDARGNVRRLLLLRELLRRWVSRLVDGECFGRQVSRKRERTGRRAFTY